MDNTLERFMTVMRDGEVPPAGLVEALGTELPAFTLPAVLRLQRGSASLSPAERESLRRRVVLNAPDFSTLYDLIGRPNDDGIPFYPPDEAPPTPGTEEAIDTFLETYGHAADPREDAMLEQMLLNPVPDYASVLEQEYSTGPHSAPADGQDLLIDAFLSKEHPLTAPLSAASPADTPDMADRNGAAANEEHHGQDTAAVPPPVRDDSSLSESLAKIYIRQGKYDKAYEILSHLNLNIPGKSIYFADQLRFLQKLMLISNHK